MMHARAIFLHNLKRLFEYRESGGTNFIRLAGSGILLRQFQDSEEDVEALAKLVAKEKDYLRDWLNERSLQELLVAQAYINNSLMRQFGTGGFDAGIWVQKQLTGVVSLSPTVTNSGVIGYLGYWLGREYQGQGLMTQSARAIVEYGFESRWFRKMRICTTAENIHSRAVAERLGFVPEMVEPKAEKINGVVMDNVVYMLMREMWRGKVLADCPSVI